MLCAIYRSNLKSGMYLYLAKANQFELVPEELRRIFGKPSFVMLFNLQGNKKLQCADNQQVQQQIEQQGFYLQMPKTEESLYTKWLSSNKPTKENTAV